MTIRDPSSAAAARSRAGSVRETISGWLFGRTAEGDVAQVAVTGGRQPSAGRELGLPIVLASIQVVGTLGAAQGQPLRRPLDAIGILLLILGPLLLPLRRRWPVATLWAITAITLLYVLMAYPYGPFVLSVIVALFHTVRSGHRLAGWLAGFALMIAHFGLAKVMHVSGAPDLGTVGVVTGWMLVVLLTAEGARVRGERVAERRRAQEAEEATRLTAERIRLARELHDVVAHNMSLINVQAGVALHLMDAQPQQARTALEAIKQASKEALVELRSILGVLRQVDERGPRQPTPGLDRLPDLAERARQAGLEVDLDVEGSLAALPVAVDVAAFRILQEAVTNVVRHAQARHLTLAVRRTSRLLILDVRDDGTGGPDASSGRHHDAVIGSGSSGGVSGRTTGGGGSGLLGMRERAVALGGWFEAGPRSPAGFGVRAELPLDTTATPGPTGDPATGTDERKAER